MTNEKEKLVLTSHKSIAITMNLTLPMPKGRRNRREESSPGPLSSTDYQVKQQRIAAERLVMSTKISTTAKKANNVNKIIITTNIRNSFKRLEVEICTDCVCDCVTLYDRHLQQQHEVNILRPAHIKQKIPKKICLTVQKTPWRTQPKLNKISATELLTTPSVAASMPSISYTIWTYASTTMSFSTLNESTQQKYTTPLPARTNMLIAKQLVQTVRLDSTEIRNAAERMSVAPTKLGHKLFAITTPAFVATPGFINCIRNTCTVISLFLIVLTLQHVSRQYLLSSRVVAATTTTVSANIALTRGNNTATATPFDLSEADAFNIKRNGEMLRQQQKPYHREPCLLEIQWVFKRSDVPIVTKSLHRWQNCVSILVSAAVNRQYKFHLGYTKPQAMYYIDQRNAVDNRLVQQHIVLYFFPMQTSHSIVHSNKVLRRLLNLSAKISKVEEAYTVDSSLTQRRSKRHVHPVINSNYKTESGPDSDNKVWSGIFELGRNLIFYKAYDDSRDRSIYADERPGIADVTTITNDYYNTRTNTFNAAKTPLRSTSGNLDLNENEDNEDNRKLLKLVLDGLGLQNLPNMMKVNISQQEYVTKYREYLIRAHERKQRELAKLPYTIPNEWKLENDFLRIVSIPSNVTFWKEYSRRKRNTQNFSENYSTDYYYPGKDDDINSEQESVIDSKQHNNDNRIRNKKKGKTTIMLRFSLDDIIVEKLQPVDIEEANIRLLLIHNAGLAAKFYKQKNKTNHRLCDGNKNFKGLTTVIKQKRVLSLKIYQLLGHDTRLLLDSRKVEVNQSVDGTQSKWLQFDVTKAVESWLRKHQYNLGFEVHCDNCRHVGARILNDVSSPFNNHNKGKDDGQLVPVLNIISRLGTTYKEIRSNKHSKSFKTVHHHHNFAKPPNGRQHTNGATTDKHSCHKPNQRCCRHTMEVVFKEIKGFEFILQPKAFDAGYCRGHCPPRYNPAHHHAMLQSLIWKKNPQHAPRPCCAPSKLLELDVLHVDEKDSEKLKISTWTDMRVVECACS